MNVRTAALALLLGLAAPAVAQPQPPALVAQAGGAFSAQVKKLDAANAAVKRADTPARKAEAGLARLQALQRVLSTIPVAGKPDARFLAAYKDEIVYNEPAGRWLVRAECFWELRAHDPAAPAAEAIAWAAARQDLPGECETDGSCVLTVEKISYGRYLELYPSGHHAKAALTAMAERLGYLSNDKQGVYQYPAESKADTDAALAYLKKVVSASTDPAKDRVLQQLAKIAAKASARR